MYPHFIQIIVNNNEKVVQKDSASLWYLLTFFLKIGSISFGGFLALISVIQREMVIKDKRIEDQTILDGITLASLLPGPLAVNTVCFIGYKLKGFWGAILSMVAVIFPSFICLVVLTHLYYQFGEIENVRKVLNILMPAIVAIIFTVGVNMTKKHVVNWKQYLIGAISIAALQVIGGVLTTIVLILLGGLIGFIFFQESNINEDKSVGNSNKLRFYPSSLVKNLVIIVLSFVLLLLSSYLWDPTGQVFKLNMNIFGVFSGMSVTLFGGGYVIIPIIQELIVDNLHWLSLEDFNVAITLSQITPGPILVSATFIGYKIGGIFGAIIATVSIFFPSGILMIFLSHSIEQIKHTAWIKAIFTGIRPVIIGLIFSAAITISISVFTGWFLVGLFFLFTLLILKYNLSSIQVILAGLAIGIITIVT